MGDLAITIQWSVPPIGERPHQPISFHFPQREFGKKTVTNFGKRAFIGQAKWFSKWPWLHYNEDSDSVYSFRCIKAYSQKKLLEVSDLEETYVYFNCMDSPAGRKLPQDLLASYCI